MSLFYGIGHVLVDYFFDGRIPVKNLSPELQTAAETHRPLHISGDEFDRLLEQLHSANPDWSAHSDSVRATGGTCVNILKTIAALGEKAVFSGSCGGYTYTPSAYRRDNEAIFFQKSLAGNGVESHITLKNGRTGRCLAVRHGGTSFILAVSPDAAADIRPEQIDEERCLKADWTIAEGMPLGHLSVRKKIADILHSRKIPLAVACGTPSGAKNTASLLAALNNEQQSMPPMIIFANDAEARILEDSGINMTDISSAMNILFVVTHGCGGSSAYVCGRRVTAAAEPVSVGFTDETGAGDVFAGAFLYRLTALNAAGSAASRGLNFLRNTQELYSSITACLLFGTAAAAKIITVPLCRITPNLFSGLQHIRQQL